MPMESNLWPCIDVKVIRWKCIGKLKVSDAKIFITRESDHVEKLTCDKYQLDMF